MITPDGAARRKAFLMRLPFVLMRVIVFPIALIIWPLKAMVDAWCDDMDTLDRWIKGGPR